MPKWKITLALADNPFTCGPIKYHNQGTPTMSDAIQVSNVDKLEPEMRTVFTMFERAANAIVRASDLGREVSKLTGEVSHLTEAYSNVDGIRQAHETRIDTFITDLASARQQIANQGEALIERSGEIDRLKADNSQLRRVLEMTTRQYDEVCASRDDYRDELKQVTSKFEDAETKLKKFREILGQPEVASVAVDPAKPGLDQTAVVQVTDRPSDGDMESTRDHGSAAPVEPIHDAASDVKSEPASHTADFTLPTNTTVSPQEFATEGGPNASVGKYERDAADHGMSGNNDPNYQF